MPAAAKTRPQAEARLAPYLYWLLRLAERIRSQPSEYGLQTRHAAERVLNAHAEGNADGAYHAGKGLESCLDQQRRALRRNVRRDLLGDLIETLLVSTPEPTTRNIIRAIENCFHSREFEYLCDLQPDGSLDYFPHLHSTEIATISPRALAKRIQRLRK